VLYFHLYLPYIKKVKIPSSDWELYAPNAFPIGVICLVGSFLCCSFAVWPIYRFWTFPIMFFISMGAFMFSVLVA